MAVARQQMPDAVDRPGRPRESASRPRKALTIGAVCKILQGEFDDISISKIRYLEDQKLLTPRRTQGGYRLYSQSDVERLRTILRLQRDEFLPLRVIRQELAAGRDVDVGADRTGGGAVRRAILVNTSSAYLTLDEVTAARFSSASSASLRRSGFRERSEGARIWFSSAASRSAEDLKTRRLRPATPYAASSRTARTISRSVSS